MSLPNWVNITRLLILREAVRAFAQEHCSSGFLRYVFLTFCADAVKVPHRSIEHVGCQKALIGSQLLDAHRHRKS